MGIPRLTQDLSPYARPVAIGLSNIAHDLPVIDKVVIDGPSLVHYIYAQVVREDKQVTSATVGQPTYRTICSRVKDFLATLQRCCVTIHAIYFDGALPIKKREERLRRLEQARSQLASFRQVNPGPFNAEAFIPIASFCSDALSLQGPQTRGPDWKVGPPPFLVPCVLDSLRRVQSQPVSASETKLEHSGIGPKDMDLNSLVKVVAGEADPYCAGIAKTAGAAILTSDSDMLMYDLGSYGSVVMLSTLSSTKLEVPIDSKGVNETLLQAEELRPSTIATRMQRLAAGKSANLQRYGFERSMDVSAPAGVIRDRTKNRVLSSTEQSRFAQFCSHYKVESDTGGLLSSVPQSLDPRLSELYWQFHDPKQFLSTEWSGPQIYLPVLFEDPSCESSWNYGRDIRAFGYSLLALSTTMKTGVRVPVYEYCRRGFKISGLPIDLKDPTELVQSGLLNIPSLNGQRDAKNVFHHWWAFVAQMVIDIKQQVGKFVPDKEYLAKLLSGGCVNGRLTWEDISFIANLQAGLYSLWILKQISSTVFVEGDLGSLVDELRGLLQDLPPLAELIDGPWVMLGADVSELHALFSEVLESPYDASSGAVTSLHPAKEHSKEHKDSSSESQAGCAKKSRAKRNLFEYLDES